jgi:hypothetical protein
MAICAILEQHPGFASHFGDTTPPVNPPSPHPFLDFIMQLLQQLMPSILGCFKTPVAVHAALQRPGLFVRMKGRQIIRQNIGADPNNAEDQLSVSVINNAVLSVAATTTVDEYTQLLS